MALAYSSSIILGSLTYSPSIVPAPTIVQTVNPLINVAPVTIQSSQPGNILDPTEDIPGAICSWWAGNSSLTALTTDGVLWYSEAPVEAIMPYAIFFLVAAAPVAKTTAYDVFHSVYQVSIYADQKDDAQILALAAAVGFDRKNIVDDRVNDILIQTQTGDVRIQLAAGLGLNGADAWMGFFNLEVFYKA